ncbi:type VII secretion EssA family protein [Bacillus sp. FSL W7-1360]
MALPLARCTCGCYSFHSQRINHGGTQFLLRYKTVEKIPEIIQQLQFAPKTDSDELVKNIAFNGESNDNILIGATNNLRLFQGTTPLSQQLADNENTSKPWLIWTLGIIAAALLVGWFIYFIPKLSIDVEQ